MDMDQLISFATKYLEGAPLVSNKEEVRNAKLLKTNIERKDGGNNLFKGEEYEQAIKVFREAYLDVSKIPWSESKKYYNDAMKLLEALRLNLAASHTKLGNFERALEFCNYAIKLRPDSNAKAFYRYALTFLLQAVRFEVKVEFVFGLIHRSWKVARRSPVLPAF